MTNENVTNSSDDAGNLSSSEPKQASDSIFNTDDSEASQFEDILSASQREKLPRDFGLAKFENQATHQLTQTGSMLGTVAYMSPEQAENPADVTVASDIYSIGAMLYASLTGDAPFGSSSTVATLRRLQVEEPKRPRNVNATVAKDLETICLKCLEKKPASRYQTANELAADLDRFLEHQPIHARQTSAFERTWKWTRRNRAVASLLAGILIVIATSAAIIAYNSREARREQLSSMANSLTTVEAKELPKLIRKLNEFPRFGESHLTNTGDTQSRFRINLGLLERHPERIENLADILPELSADEVLAFAKVIQACNWDAETKSDVVESIVKHSANRLTNVLPVAGLLASSKASS